MEQCIRPGMVSIHFVNVAGHNRWSPPPAGPNPASAPTRCASPCRARTAKPAALLDMAASVIAMGKARVAKLKGEEVPPGTLLRR